MKTSFLKKLVRDQRGLSTMEYAVLFVIIVVGGLSLWSTLGTKLKSQMTSGTSAFDSTLGASQQQNGG